MCVSRQADVFFVGYTGHVIVEVSEGRSNSQQTDKSMFSLVDEQEQIHCSDYVEFELVGCYTVAHTHRNIAGWSEEPLNKSLTGTSIPVQVDSIHQAPGCKLGHLPQALLQPELVLRFGRQDEIASSEE